MLFSRLSLLELYEALKFLQIIDLKLSHWHYVHNQKIASSIHISNAPFPLQSNLLRMHFSAVILFEKLHNYTKRRALCQIRIWLKGNKNIFSLQKKKQKLNNVISLGEWTL